MEEKSGAIHETAAKVKSGRKRKNRGEKEALSAFAIRLLDKVNKNVPTRTCACTCEAITDGFANIFYCILLSVLPLQVASRLSFFFLSRVTAALSHFLAISACGPAELREHTVAYMCVLLVRSVKKKKTVASFNNSCSVFNKRHQQFHRLTQKN